MIFVVSSFLWQKSWMHCISSHLKPSYSCYKYLINIWRVSNNNGSSIADKAVFIAWVMKNKVIEVVIKKVTTSFSLISSKELLTSLYVKSSFFTASMKLEIAPSLRAEISYMHAS